MTNERDTHFLGFAELLLHKPDDNEEQLCTTFIAQGAYDLVVHTPSGDLYIRYFKDMTEWPQKDTSDD